jgi:hypothetical protein
MVFGTHVLKKRLLSSFKGPRVMTVTVVVVVIEKATKKRPTKKRDKRER